MGFQLDQRLEEDTLHVTELPLCTVRLMNDRRFPWLILVPKKEDVREIFQLEADDRQALLDEACATAALLENLHAAEKMNVAALGNMVPQLHVHVIARQKNDEAWPGPVWGVGKAVPYEEEAALGYVTELKRQLDEQN